MCSCKGEDEGRSLRVAWWQRAQECELRNKDTSPQGTLETQNFLLFSKNF